MANLLGALRFTLGADTAAFERGMTQAQSRLQSFGVSATRAGAVAGAAFAGLAVAVGVSLQRILNQMDQMLKASQSIGIPIEALSGLRHAADLSGVSFENLITSMTRLSRAMQESVVTPTSTAARTFQALGISVQSVPGQFRPTMEVMEALAEQFRRFEDGAGKTALAVNIFGRAGAAMIPLLNLGRDGLRQAADEAARLGLVFNDQTARGAEAFNDNMRRLRLASDGLVAAVATALVPTLEMLSERMFGMVSNGDQLKAFVDAITGAFRFLTNVAATLHFTFTTLAREIVQLASAVQEFVGGGGIALFNQRMAEMGAETARAREQLRLFGLELQRSGEGFRGVAGKIGDEVTRIPPPIINSARAVGDAMRRMRDEARAALDDIVQAPTQSFVAKMEAINRAVREGTITMRQYGQMVRTVTRENQQHWFDLGTATATALTTIFSKNKVAQIASIIILTSVAIMRALATLPPPFSWAQAALAAATGAAQLAAVRSTSMSGAGKAPTVSGGGGGDGGGGGAPASALQSQTLTVMGIDPFKAISGAEFRDFAERMLQYQRDGGKVVLA